MRRPRHSHLRESTADIHDEVEKAVAAQGFFDEALQYRAYLGRLYSCHRRLVEATSELADVSATMPRFSAGLEARVGWLAADLTDLGTEPPSKLWLGCRVPRIASRSSYLGMLYVLFGAALGARVLVKQARTLLDEHGRAPGCGLIYLTKLSESMDWPLFLTALEEEPQLCLSTATGAAEATFACVLDHMTGSAPA